MIEHIDPTKATTTSNECPCVMILHIAQKLIKNNKITSGCKLTNRYEVLEKLRDMGNIRDVKVVGVQGAITSNEQGRAISNDDTQARGNRPT